MKYRTKVFCTGAILGFLGSWVYVLAGGDYWLFIPKWAEIIFYAGFLVGKFCYDLFRNEPLAVFVGTLSVGLFYGIVFVFLLSVWNLLVHSRQK